ncbi:MAG: MBL fold metallo-hydrolase, partial [Vicinamibacterales bacterium]
MRPGRGRLSVLCALVILAGLSLWWAPAFEAVGQAGAGPARHRMTRITDTIYRADAPGTPGINSTSWVFINDTDVLVTDSEGSPASARALLEGVKSVTSKPVRYLVDTHFHLDHAYGNAGLPPEVQIIGHDYTRKALLGPEARTGTTITFFTTPMPGRIVALKAQASSEGDPAKKATLQAQIASAEATLAAYSGNFPLKAPDVTISQSMSLWSGAKEFRILYLGRA